MWALNIVRNNNGDEEAEVKEIINENEDNQNDENIKDLINEKSDDSQGKSKEQLVVNHYRRHCKKYVCGVVLVSVGYLFYRFH